VRNVVEHAARPALTYRPTGLDPTAFNLDVLKRPPYWWRQRQLARVLRTYPTVLAPTGNAVGKTYLAAGLILWFLYEHPGSLVIATAPTQTQLEEVLWKEVNRAFVQSGLPGRSSSSPLKIDLGGGWKALGYSTNKTERLSGHHATDLLAVIDEASGVEPEIIEAIDSLNPSRLLMIGNPLRPDGPFYERCMSAEKGRDDAIVIQIASTESPDINRPRGTDRSLADAGWLQRAKNDYGENSLWWKSHVLGQFPDAGSDSLLNRNWIDSAAQAQHVRGGWPRMAIDLSEGNGGDRSVILVRDDNGVLDLVHSPRWSLETTATNAALAAQKWGVDPSRITWDASGIGADFSNRLEAVQLCGCRPYRGGMGGGKKFGNLRSAAAWAMRQRFDPEHLSQLGPGPGVRQPIFAVRPEWVGAMRDELQGLRYQHDKKGSVELEPKEDLARRLRKSPDLADALIMSFAFP